MIHHIHRLRQHPEHVRKSIAFASAGALTALVAVGWLAATVAGGTLNLAPSSLASASAPVVEASAQTGSAFSQLMGAVGAAVGATSTAPAALQIVDGRSTSTIAATTSASASQKTVIPF